MLLVQLLLSKVSVATRALTSLLRRMRSMPLLQPGSAPPRACRAMYPLQSHQLRLLQQVVGWWKYRWWKYRPLLLPQLLPPQLLLAAWRTHLCSPPTESEQQERLRTSVRRSRCQSLQEGQTYPMPNHARFCIVAQQGLQLHLNLQR